MNLVQLEAERFAVFAVCDQNWGCPVLACLDAAEGQYPAAYQDMRTILFEEVPRNGVPTRPRKWIKRLKDPFLEFKSKEPPRVIALRVIFFQKMENTAIICTNAFLKNGKAPDWLSEAQQRLAEYDACSWDEIEIRYLIRPEKPWRIH
ncbi:MAG TPA: hypothetical protein VHR45_11185 [Thermoanaerobaculia bacterium]|nr:hypothetical protein [Thermoanaerobaculia bacterium]